MKKTFFKYVTAGVLLCCSLPVTAAQRGWEPVRGELSGSRLIHRESDYEIRAVSGAILVTASRPVQIKVFTILGRLVSSETLPAGTSRLTLPASGVYIVRLGSDLTIKIAI